MSTKAAPDQARESPARSALVIFPGALGDFVCFLPALEHLANRYALDLLSARSDVSGLIGPDVAVGSIERREVSRLFVRGGGGENAVRCYFSRYASVYSWLGHDAAPFQEELARATGGRGRVFPPRPAPGEIVHQVDHYLRCVGAAPNPGILPRARLREEGLRWREEFFRRHRLNGRRVLALAPGSGAREKNWPARCFESVGEWWRKHASGEVFWVLGPVEEERGGVRPPPGVVPVRGLDLMQLGHLLEGCDAYVGNDSGVTHLAAAVGTPTLAIFGPSDARCWAPRGPHVEILSRRVPCSPCGPLDMRRCPERACLADLAPELVMERLGNLLKSLA